MAATDTTEQTPATAAPAEPVSSGTPIPGGPDTGHDYDGIREFDNRLPNWWLVTLFASIAFGFGYWTYYHVVVGTPTAQDELAWELEEAARAADAFAKARGAPTDDALAALAAQPVEVATGQQLFTQYCVACHGVDGQGVIGPNLTDPYWLHGWGKPTDILKVVSGGVAAKGMPAWEPALGPAKIEKVVAFVLTIKDRNRPGKDPQGQAVQ